MRVDFNDFKQKVGRVATITFKLVTIPVIVIVFLIVAFITSLVALDKFLEEWLRDDDLNLPRYV